MTSVDVRGGEVLMVIGQISCKRINLEYVLCIM